MVAALAAPMVAITPSDVRSAAANKAVTDLRSPDRTPGGAFIEDVRAIEPPLLASRGGPDACAMDAGDDSGGVGASGAPVSASR